MPYASFNDLQPPVGVEVTVDHICEVDEQVALLRKERPFVGFRKFFAVGNLYKAVHAVEGFKGLHLPPCTKLKARREVILVVVHDAGPCKFGVLPAIGQDHGNVLQGFVGAAVFADDMRSAVKYGQLFKSFEILRPEQFVTVDDVGFLCHDSLVLCSNLLF